MLFIIEETNNSIAGKNKVVIILADGPTGNLDSKTRKHIVELLYSLAREGKTVIMPTHSTEVAAAADIKLEMMDGKIEETLTAS